VLIVHIDIYDITLFRSRSTYKTNCSLTDGMLFFAEHILIANGEHGGVGQLVEKRSASITRSN
jgi:hypothetical protein